MQLSVLQSKAVLTSHCSQPNTIEYEMALEWMILKEAHTRKFRKLHEVGVILIKICVNAVVLCLTCKTLILHLQSVCRRIEITGRGLQVWAARVQGWRSSKLVVVPYQMEAFVIITSQDDGQVSCGRRLCTEFFFLVAVEFISCTNCTIR